MRFKLLLLASLTLAPERLYAECPAGTTLSIRTAHFVICQDPSSTATPGYLADVATFAEESFSFVTVTQNFRLPPGAAVSPISDAQRQKIIVQARPLALGFADTDISTPPIMRIDDNYAAAEGWSSTGTVALRSTLVHEMLHASQQAYVNPSVWLAIAFDWIMEGTSAWIEDELPALDSVNTYLPAHENWAGQLLSSPEVSLDQRTGLTVGGEGPMLFYKFLSEKGMSIRQWLENLAALGLTAPDNAKALDALGDAIKLVTGSRAPFDIYGDFSAAAIAKAGPFGFQDDGASQLPDPAFHATTTQADPNAHVFTAGAADVPHLASRFLLIGQPSLLDKPSRMRAALTAHGPVWDAKAVVFRVAGATTAVDMTPSQGKRVMETEFGATRPTPNPNEVFRVVVAAANVSKTQDKSWTEFQSKVAPNFRDAYTPNPANGTTKTVKNLLPSNAIHKGTVVKLEATLSAEATSVDANFSQVDTAFDPAKMVISPAAIGPSGAVYTIAYPVSYLTTATTGAVKIEAITEDARKPLFRAEDNSLVYSLTGEWDYLWDAGQLPEEAGWTKETSGRPRPTAEIAELGIFHAKLEGTSRLFYTLRETFLVNAPLTIEFRIQHASSPATSGQVNSFAGMSDQFVLAFLIKTMGLDKVGLDFVVEPFPPDDFNNFFMNTKDSFHIYRMTLDAARTVRVFIDGTLRLQAQATSPPEPNSLFNIAFFAPYEGLWDYVAFKGNAALDPSLLPSPPTALPEEDPLGPTQAKGNSNAPSFQGGLDPIFRLGDVYAFPSPARGSQNPTFHIEVGQADEVEVFIYDVSGALVETLRTTGSPQTINSTLAYEIPWTPSASGIYVAVIQARKAGEADIRLSRKFGVIR